MAWLVEDGVPRCAPLPSSDLVSFGRCGGAREAESTAAESLVALYRVDTDEIRQRQKAARSSTSQGRDEPLCARIEGANREVSERGADIRPRFFLLPTRATTSDERARIVGLFQGRTGLSTAGCWLARRLHQLKASTTLDLCISIFLIYLRCVALRNFDFLTKTDWSVICPLCC